MQRPSRTRKAKLPKTNQPSSPSTPSCKEASKNWTKTEKAQIIEGLKKYKASDFKNLESFVPSRTQEQVRNFILRYQAKNDASRSENPLAPVDSWLQLLHSLQWYTPVDLSEVMQQMFTMIAYLEPHETEAIQEPQVDTNGEPQASTSKDPMPGTSKESQEAGTSNMEPNYKNIYLYLSSLLEGVPDTSLLSPIDNAVFLDIMKSFIEDRKELDTGEQSGFIREKYKQLLSLSNLEMCTYLNSIPNEVAEFGDSDSRPALIGHISLKPVNECKDGGNENNLNETVGAEPDQSAIMDIEDGSQIAIASPSPSSPNLDINNTNTKSQDTNIRPPKRKGRRPAGRRGRKRLALKTNNFHIQDRHVKDIGYTANPLSIPVRMLRRPEKKQNCD